MKTENNDRKMIFCGEWLDVLNCYENDHEKQNQLFKAILNYGLGVSDGSQIAIDLRPVFISIKSVIDRMQGKYKTICSARSEAGKKGMAARWNKKTYSEEQEQIFNKIVSSWNNIQDVTKIKAITEERKENILIILQSFTESDFYTVYQNINNSKFLKGHNQEAWQITFDWLVKSTTNFSKVLENQYENRQSNNQQNGVNDIWKQ